MRTITAFLVAVFCAIFGGAVLAAGTEGKAYDAVKVYLGLEFCSLTSCYTGKRPMLPHPESVCLEDGLDHYKRVYLLEEVSSLVRENIPRPDDMWELERDFKRDLKKSRTMDNFKFTKEHVKDCDNMLKDLFEENYDPTFNIELLR